jgi:hypothetical protein
MDVVIGEEVEAPKVTVRADGAETATDALGRTLALEFRLTAIEGERARLTVTPVLRSRGDRRRLDKLARTLTLDRGRRRRRLVMARHPAQGANLGRFFGFRERIREGDGEPKKVARQRCILLALSDLRKAKTKSELTENKEIRKN